MSDDRGGEQARQGKPRGPNPIFAEAIEEVTRGAKIGDASARAMADFFHGTIRQLEAHVKQMLDSNQPGPLNPLVEKLTSSMIDVLVNRAQTIYPPAPRATQAAERDAPEASSDKPAERAPGERGPAS